MHTSVLTRPGGAHTPARAHSGGLWLDRLIGGLSPPRLPLRGIRTHVSSKPWANRGVYRFPPVIGDAVDISLIPDHRNINAARQLGAQLSQSSRQSQSITQRLARAVRCPNHPGAESIHEAPPIGRAHTVELVTIGSLGCPCSYQHPSTASVLCRPSAASQA